MIRPNFFIVGAPKCGTTALSEYLRMHPNIFISSVKEPHFFAEDLPAYRYPKDLKSYQSLFPASPEYSKYGEASVYYLFSKTAIKNIKEYNPDAKIIAMIRNPIDLAYSLHSQFIHSRSEKIDNFEKAWHLQSIRKAGKKIPRLCNEPKLLQYKDVAKVGEQIERLLSYFPPNQVKIIFFDDFKKNTKIIYEDVLHFLGLASDGRTEFPRINANRAHRIGWIGTFIVREPKSIQHFVKILKKFLGINKFNILNRINNLNTVTKPREPLPLKFRKEMYEEFKDDMVLLANITGRDLSNWQIHED